VGKARNDTGTVHPTHLGAVQSLDGLVRTVKLSRYDTVLGPSKVRRGSDSLVTGAHRHVKSVSQRLEPRDHGGVGDDRRGSGWRR
jgi:hypothetical protein